MTSFLAETQWLTLRYLSVAAVFAMVGILYSVAASSGWSPAWLRPVLMVVGCFLANLVWHRTTSRTDERLRSTAGSRSSLIEVEELVTTGDHSAIRTFLLGVTRPDARADAYVAVNFLVSQLENPENVLALGPGLFTLRYRQVHVYFAIQRYRSSRLKVALIGGSIAQTVASEEPLESASTFGIVELAPVLRDVTSALAAGF